MRVQSGVIVDLGRLVITVWLPSDGALADQRQAHMVSDYVQWVRKGLSKQSPSMICKLLAEQFPDAEVEVVEGGRYTARLCQ